MKSPHDFPAINPKRPDGIKPNGIPYKVMVIDDKEFHRKQIIQILESEGYEIIAAASNGAEALKLYESLAADLDLITTDLDMPKLDGYALLYELSHKKPKAKIVFISEETTKGVLSDLLKMGAADYILKPIQRGTILEQIKAVLQKK